jgi:NAD(P)-dependent dehydrogenase (short-subunit alcohol dehydrogenase family)
MMDRLTGKKKEEQFTALEPVGRMGQPEEIANVVWMCSDEASCNWTCHGCQMVVLSHDK